MDTFLNEIDFTNSQVRKVLTELLPSKARSKCAANEALPAELIEEVVAGVKAGAVADLVLELAILLTGGSFAEEVEIEMSSVDLAPDQGAQLVFDLRRPDWTVGVSLHTLEEPPESGTEGVLATLVHAGFDFRGWLAEERPRAMLHEWYVQHQISGTLHSGRQLAELREELPLLIR